MRPICRIVLLGSLQVDLGDRSITNFRTRQTGALLAYLAYYPRSHARDELVERFWPSLEGGDGRHQLRNALSSLRRQLEPPGVHAGTVLKADRRTVQLNAAALVTDVREFEAGLDAARRACSVLDRVHWLMEAAGLYPGELLPEHFDEWITGERQRLANLHARTLKQLVQLFEQEGDVPRALEYAQRAVSAGHASEEAYYHLIRLLAATGQPEAALRQYRELERVLREEFGTEPAQESRELLDQIQGQGRVTGRAQVAKAAREAIMDTVVESPTPGASLRPPSLPPLGTVTFLLAGVPGPSEHDGSSRARAAAVMEALRQEFQRYAGGTSDGRGGALVAVFGRASDAAAAAAASMKNASAFPGAALAPAELPRMALHAGEVEAGATEFRGAALEHALRLLTAAHSGQILCSETAAALLRAPGVPTHSGVSLVDLGPQRLGGDVGNCFAQERLFQVNHLDLAERAFPPPQGSLPFAGHLPLQVDRFFGRQAEITRLCEAVVRGLPAAGDGSPSAIADPASSAGSPRLITITGPGGTGKTRLATETARRLVEQLRGAVWFVPLGDLLEPRLIPAAARDVLRLPRLSDREPLEQVVEALIRQPSLLVVDSLEHLLTEGSAIVWKLLEQVPQLVVLATSRQRLDLPGEQEIPIGPLPVPRMTGRSKSPAENGQSARTSGPDPTSLLEYPSVQLFVDRAQLVRPDFQLTMENAAATADLCRRLEGIPLALELAAARLSVLTLTGVIKLPWRDFKMSEPRQRNAHRRHWGLADTLDWSYNLLSAPQQQFFQLLSIFRGGCTLEAVEAVCAPRDVVHPEDRPGQTLDFLEQLRTASLLDARPVVEELPDIHLPEAVIETGLSIPVGISRQPLTEMRYQLLEPLREYGWERLARARMLETTRSRHLAYFVALAEQAEPNLLGPEQATWLVRLEWDHENLRAALDWAVQSEPVTGLRLARALSPFWEVRGHWAEGRGWLRLLLDKGATASAESRGAGLVAAGRLALGQSDYAEAAKLGENALKLVQHTRNRQRRAEALHLLGCVAASRSDYQEARALYDESLTLWRRLDDPRGLAAVLHSLGVLALHRGENARADALSRESLALRRMLGDRRGIAATLGQQGLMARQVGDHEHGWESFAQSLASYCELNDRSGVAIALQGLGRVAHEQGYIERARALYEESLAIRRELGDRRGIAMVLQSLGHLDHALGDCTGARRRHEESLTIRTSLGEKRERALSLFDLANTALTQGEIAEAGNLYGESLAIAQQIGARPLLACCLAGVGMVAQQQRQPERAVRLFGAADALRKAIGDTILSSRQDEYDRHLAAARAALSAADFAAAWDQGRRMTAEQAALLARRDGTSS